MNILFGSHSSDSRRSSSNFLAHSIFVSTLFACGTSRSYTHVMKTLKTSEIKPGRIMFRMAKPFWIRKSNDEPPWAGFDGPTGQHDSPKSPICNRRHRQCPPRRAQMSRVKHNAKDWREQVEHNKMRIEGSSKMELTKYFCLKMYFDFPRESFDSLLMIKYISNRNNRRSRPFLINCLLSQTCVKNKINWKN